MAVALITGGAQRIGAHMCKELAKAGWTIALHYNGSRDKALRVADEITALGADVEIFGANFMDEREVGALMGRVIEQMGEVSCLINNASTFENDTALNATREGWDKHMEVNMRAPFVLSQAFAQALGEGRKGDIINIIDQRVWNLTPHFATYTLSKAGLWAMTQTLSQALAPQIKVNAIGPGPTLPSVRQSEDDFKDQYLSVPLKKPTDLLDISNAVLYMLGSSSMTGQMIALDGGEHLGWAQGDNKTPPPE